MRLEDFDYVLPLHMIAQEPLAERDRSKLFVLDRRSGTFEHRHFYEICEYLRPGDLLVMNDTKVSALRLIGTKPTGGRVELLLLRELGENRWDALAKPARRANPGTVIRFAEELTARIVDRTEGGGRIVEFSGAGDTAETIRRLGEVPLPPYIHSALQDVSQYQTVYASQPGSAAAPTAGFHFTPELLARVRDMGVQTVSITLHIGLATFRPVRTEIITDHVMHTEMVSISEKSATAVNSADGRIIAVGTTTARALESAAVGHRQIAPMEGETNLYITPGYEFQVTDALITNFHMPKSTLLILVSAFAGREVVMRAYAEAKEQNYRFLSFGDAMFII